MWRYQWLTFAIHTPEQPDPKCYLCPNPASWLLTWWHDNAPGAIFGRACCKEHISEASRDIVLLPHFDVIEPGRPDA